MTKRIRRLIVGLVATATTAAVLGFPALDGPTREPAYARITLNGID